MTLADAIQDLEKGDWEAAHRIVQDDTSPLGCWAHGIVHLMEGDTANAGYWYRRADRQFPESRGTRPPEDVIAAEIAALKSLAGGSMPPS